MRALQAAPVAQRIESRTSNPKVAGSNPAGRASVPTTYDDSGSHQESLAHALPTSHAEDPDIALIVGLWNRLPDECKQRVIEMVRANTPGNPPQR